jgi:CheY-like chemotaxis protein
MLRATVQQKAAGILFSCFLTSLIWKIVIKRMILIIDDSPSDIELTKIALEATGREISIHSATDGKSALAMLRKGSWLPYLVLLDLKMQGMGGLEVLREMRVDHHLKDLPVIVVTSSSLESDRADLISAGADGYILKHMSLERFSQDLESVLHRWLPNYA